MEKKDPDQQKLSSAVFKVGAIALAFLIVGYQAALFVTRAAKLRLEANRDQPDTVFVYSAAPDSLAAPGVGLQTRATLGIVRGGDPSLLGGGPKDVSGRDTPETTISGQ